MGREVIPLTSLFTVMVGAVASVCRYVDGYRCGYRYYLVCRCVLVGMVMIQDLPFIRCSRRSRCSSMVLPVWKTYIQRLRDKFAQC